MTEHHDGHLGLSGGGVLVAVAIEVLVDVWPDWLAIAIEHAEAAEDHARAQTAPRAELRASLQAVTAAAISVEALHRLVRKHSADPPTVKRGGAALLAAATFRHEFGLAEAEAVLLGQRLEELYAARGDAVHPAGHAQPPMYAPERGTILPPLEAEFTAGRAASRVQVAVDTIRDVVSWMPDARSAKIRDTDAARCAGRLHEVLSAARPQWTAHSDGGGAVAG